MATEKSLKADVSSVSPSSNRSDERLTLQTSAFKLFTVANFTLSTQLITRNYPVILSHRRSTTVSLETYPLYPFVLSQFNHLDSKLIKFIKHFNPWFLPTISTLMQRAPQPNFLWHEIPRVGENDNVQIFWLSRRAWVF